MTNEPLLVETLSSGVAWVTLNRPEVHNAFDDDGNFLGDAPVALRIRRSRETGTAPLPRTASARVLPVERDSGGVRDQYPDTTSNTANSYGGTCGGAISTERSRVPSEIVYRGL